ncbi:Divalent-cation tolerance protein CutA [groundwater metagenome]|uniref:Divalent-cation tolerance protein CutA n=1 Tax=groundwater metagenome TaxID=717931 RepID=A0A098E9E8_9ZZZZ
MTYSIVYTTAGSEKEAENICKNLIEKNLAACINTFPIKSFYKWKGKFETSNEIAMLIKTRGELAEKVTEEIKKIHSYEIPAIFSISIEKGDDNFFNWIDKNLVVLKI